MTGAIYVRDVPSPRYADRPSSIRPPKGDDLGLEPETQAVVLRTPDRDGDRHDVYLPPKTLVDLQPTVEKLIESEDGTIEQLSNVATVERKRMRVRSTCFVCHSPIDSRTSSIEFAQHYWTQYDNHGSAKVRMHTTCVNELDAALDNVWDETDVLLADVI